MDEASVPLTANAHGLTGPINPGHTDKPKFGTSKDSNDKSLGRRYIPSDDTAGVTVVVVLSRSVYSVENVEQKRTESPLLLPLTQSFNLSTN